MKRLFKGISFGVWMALLSSHSFAEIRKVRITEFENPQDVSEMFQKVNSVLLTSFGSADFAIAENRQLKGMQFFHLSQMRGGKPIEGAALRLWIDPTGSIIAVEGFLDRPTNKNGFGSIRSSMKKYLKEAYLKDPTQLKSQEDLVRASMRAHGDPVEMDFNYDDRWKGEDFQRVFVARGKTGFHEVRFSHRKQEIVEHNYKKFLTAVPKELDPIPAVAFKVYEENYANMEAEPMTVEPVELKYLNVTTTTWEVDPFLSVTAPEYSLLENKEMLVSYGMPAELSTWSFEDLQKQLLGLQATVAPVTNGFDGPNGLALDGRYVQITVHPDVREKLKDLDYKWLFSGELNSKRILTSRNQPGIKFQTNYRSTVFKTAEELLISPERDLEHSIEKYITQGADQIQVYWAVTEMMDQLHKFGFSDPEISTRKFTAILYNPEPSFRNNAYYVADTLNFTTYSGNTANFARDNTTIWHEQGHGIVDRIMGPALLLAKSGGFNEGVADFFAEIILQATSFQKDFPGKEQQRIYKSTPFGMSNQSHDDGEAFGGAMKSVLDQAIEAFGEEGVGKTADLLLESMRFTRNHPKLDEQEWFEKLKFSDTRGSSVRESGEFSNILDNAFKGRNFTADGKELAEFKVEIDGRVLGPNIDAANETRKYTIGTPKEFDLKVTLVDGADFQFRFPMRVVIESPMGALFGLDWVGEELGPKAAVINTSGETAVIPMGLTGNCDIVFSGTACSDLLTIKVYEAGSDKVFVKKQARFKMDVPGASLLFRQ